MTSSSSSGLLRNQTLESTATQHTLTDLTPGRLFNITMVTEAGGLQNSQTTSGQTGEERRRRRRRRVKYI